MFLKDWVYRLLYKPYCEKCRSPLESHFILCSECQTHCYYYLYQAANIYQSCDMLLVSLFHNHYFGLLYKLSQNSRNQFLLDALLNLVLVQLTLPIIPWPRAIIKTQLFDQKKLNQIFMEKLSKKLQMPIQTHAKQGIEKGTLVFLLE